MGAINYKTSEFITIGYDCSGIDYDDEYYYEFISDCYDQASRALENYRFYYFDVSIEPGYYDGFSINIEFEYTCFDDYIEKKEAQKEITQIKKYLLECIEDYNCVAVWPGWCTGYDDYKETLQTLDAAVRNMRDTVKNTPTWRTRSKIA